MKLREKGRRRESKQEALQVARAEVSYDVMVLQRSLGLVEALEMLVDVQIEVVTFVEYLHLISF